jgi:hypothetical protein
MRCKTVDDAALWPSGLALEILHLRDGFSSIRNAYQIRNLDTEPSRICREE